MAGEYKRRKAPERKVAEAAASYEALTQEPVLSTISSKNQITLPVQMLRELGIGPGDRVSMRLEGDRLILRPRPKEWAKYYAGSMAGVYGRTKEEIDAYIREGRDDSRRMKMIEEAWDGRGPASEK